MRLREIENDHAAERPYRPVLAGPPVLVVASLLLMVWSAPLWAQSPASVRLLLAKPHDIPSTTPPAKASPTDCAAAAASPNAPRSNPLALRGKEEDDLRPVRGSRRTVLALNLDATRAPGIRIPAEVFRLADEVIEGSINGGL